MAPSSTGDVLAAGTAGMSIGSAVYSLASAIPGSFYLSVVSSLIGLAAVYINSRKEIKVSVIEARSLKKENEELKAELRYWRTGVKPPIP